MRFSYCIFDTFRVPGGRVRLAVSDGWHCPVPGASALHRPPWAEPCLPKAKLIHMCNAYLYVYVSLIVLVYLCKLFYTSYSVSTIIFTIACPTVAIKSLFSIRHFTVDTCDVRLSVPIFKVLVWSWFSTKSTLMSSTTVHVYDINITIIVMSISTLHEGNHYLVFFLDFL